MESKITIEEITEFLESKTAEFVPVKEKYKKLVADYNKAIANEVDKYCDQELRDRDGNPVKKQHL